MTNRSVSGEARSCNWRVHSFVTIAVILIGLFAACAKQKATALEMGIRSFEEEDYARARAHFESVIATEPQNAQGLYYLGRVEMTAGELDSAITHFEKAVALEGASSEYLFRLGVAYAQKIQKVSFFEQGELAPKIKESFEKAVAADGENLDARMALAQYYLNAPPIVGGSVEKAMEQIAAVKARDARRAHLMMARVYSAKKDYDSAEGELKEALALDAKDMDVHYQLGVLYQTKSDFDAAFDILEKALAIDSGYMPALYQIGRTAALSGDHLDRGVACLTAYLEKTPGEGQPSWAHAHWRLGMIYERMDERDLARREYQAALDLDPGLAEARNALDQLEK